jgi:hypothetical protein
LNPIAKVVAQASKGRRLFAETKAFESVKVSKVQTVLKPSSVAIFRKYGICLI